jgi:hypothetical protein
MKCEVPAGEGRGARGFHHFRDGGATSYITSRPSREAYGRAFPCDITNAATPKQIAIPKVAVNKGNHIWRYGHIWRSSLVRFLSGMDIVITCYFC